MSLRDIMAADLATIHADTNSAAEDGTYTKSDGTTISGRATISQLGFVKTMGENGLNENNRASGFFPKAVFPTVTTRDTWTRPDGTIWAVVSVPFENAAVFEAELMLTTRPALIPQGSMRQS